MVLNKLHALYDSTRFHPLRRTIRYIVLLYYSVADTTVPYCKIPVKKYPCLLVVLIGAKTALFYFINCSINCSAYFFPAFVKYTNLGVYNTFRIEEEIKLPSRVT